MPKYNKATSNLYVIKQSKFFFLIFFYTRNIKNISNINNKLNGKSITKTNGKNYKNLRQINIGNVV